MKFGLTSTLLLLAGSPLLFSCAPAVLNTTYMDEGSRDVSFEALREQRDQDKGKLFILGGVIVRTKLTNSGAVIEAMHVPVDGSGYFSDSGRSEGRYFAALPKEAPLLDPAIYAKGRRVTLAAEFVETRKGRIDEMDYAYPLFRIRQLYLWPRERMNYYPPPYLYDPWFYPYPYYYGYPWWRHPHRHAPAPIRPHTPSPPRRTPSPEQHKER